MPRSKVLPGPSKFVFTVKTDVGSNNESEPAIHVLSKSESTHFRELNAQLHRLAADLELASMAVKATWIVEVEAIDHRAGRVLCTLDYENETDRIAALNVMLELTRILKR